MEGFGAENIQNYEGFNWSKAWSIVVQWTGFVGKIYASNHGSDPNIYKAFLQVFALTSLS